MPESLQISTLLPAPPRDVYRAWLSSREHGAFTHSQASVDPRVGGRHTAWGDYITGTSLSLGPDRRLYRRRPRRERRRRLLDPGAGHGRLDGERGTPW